MCEHDLEPLNYVFDDYGYVNNTVWDKEENTMGLYYCKKCGQVFVRPCDYKGE